MPLSTRIAALKVLGRDPEKSFPSPESDELSIQVELEDGRWFAVAVSTPDTVAARLNKSGKGFLAEPRMVFVARADMETVAAALIALTQEMSGYWVRRYRVDAKPRHAAPPKVARVELAEKAQGHCVAEVFTADKRQFSVLAATAPWWTETFSAQGLEYYFGAPVLFVDELVPKRLRPAADAIALEGDSELCLYDAPRTTLPAVLADFKAKHLKKE